MAVIWSRIACLGTKEGLKSNGKRCYWSDGCRLVKSRPANQVCSQQSQEYKREAVGQIKSGRSIAVVARVLGIPTKPVLATGCGWLPGVSCMKAVLLELMFKTGRMVRHAGQWVLGLSAHDSA